jgi:hypothetical protein
MAKPNLDIVIDCHELETLLDFWAAALGYREIGVYRKGEYALLRPDDPSYPPVLLQRVPEPKTAKNRVHFDLRVEIRLVHRAGGAGNRLEDVGALGQIIQAAA